MIVMAEMEIRIIVPETVKKNKSDKDYNDDVVKCEEAFDNIEAFVKDKIKNAIGDEYEVDINF